MQQLVSAAGSQLVPEEVLSPNIAGRATSDNDREDKAGEVNGQSFEEQGAPVLSYHYSPPKGEEKKQQDSEDFLRDAGPDGIFHYDFSTVSIESRPGSAPEQPHGPNDTPSQPRSQQNRSLKGEEIDELEKEYAALLVENEPNPGDHSASSKDVECAKGVELHDNKNRDTKKRRCDKSSVGKGMCKASWFCLHWTTIVIAYLALVITLRFEVGWDIRGSEGWLLVSMISFLVVTASFVFSHNKQHREPF